MSSHVSNRLHLLSFIVSDGFSTAAARASLTGRRTLGDYAKFARLWFRSVEPQILTRTQVEELASPHEGNYAAGWYSVRRDRGRGNVLTHAGSNTDWRAVVWLAPVTGKACIVAANATNDETPGILDGIIWKLINHEP